jgi:WD repeat-containing protein 34
MDVLSVTLKNPINLSYDANKGPIYSISSSPFHRNLFLTCGTDSEIKLYSLLQSSPLLHLCPNQGYLYSISWSKTRPCVFACGTNKGQILFYDLAKTTSSSLQTIQASDKPIYTLEFNEKRSGYLATGDGSGYVKIWSLSSNLVNQDVDELKKLSKLSEKPFEL